MQAAYRTTATVGAGNRLEISAPELVEGDSVEVIVLLSHSPSSETDTSAFKNTKERRSMLDIIQSLPSGPRSAPTWEEIERNFQEERNSSDN